MKERNRSIDIFRYVCAVLVVAIHTHPGTDINQTIGYIATDILTRFAVPFFFVVAGYFYIKALESRKKVFFSYLIRLLKIYVCWSAVYFALDYVLWGCVDPRAFLKKCIYSFLVTGSYYHFWYFPALIFSVCLTTMIYKLRLQKLMLPLSFILYTVGCLGCSYYAIGVRIPGLSALFLSPHFNEIRRILLMAVPFFTAGLLVSKIEQYIIRKNISQSAITVALIVAVVCWLLEIFIVTAVQLQTNIVITFGLYVLTVAIMIFLLRHPMPQAKQISQKCHVLADFTYYAHPFIITMLSLSQQILGFEPIPPTVTFLLAVVIAGIVGMVVYYLFRRKR